MGADSSKPNNNTRPNEASGVNRGNPTPAQTRPASRQFNSGPTTQTSYVTTSYQQENRSTVHQPVAGPSRVVNTSELRTTYNFTADQLRSMANSERLYPNLNDNRNIATETAPPAVSKPATSVNSATPGVSRPATSLNSATPGVSRPTTSLNSVTHGVSRPTTSLNSVTHGVSSPTTSVNSATPGVSRPTTSLNSLTHGVSRPTTSVNSATPGVSRPTTSVNSATPGVSRPTTSLNSVTHGVSSNRSAPPSAPLESNLPLAANFASSSGATTQKSHVSRPTSYQQENRSTVHQPVAGPSRRELSPAGPRDLNCCPTCGQMFGDEIYQCSNGHSACHICKSTGRRCRDRTHGSRECGGSVSDMRNFQVEKLVQEMKVECPNNAVGCVIRLRQQSMPAHLRECIFREMNCPLAAVFGICTWTGKRGDDMLRHFDVCHPETRRVGVNEEGFLHRPWNDTRVIHLVNLNHYFFIVHIKVSEVNGSLRMAVQQIGTRAGAAKWKYELHLYNKAEPRRKFTYADACTSDADPIDDVLSQMRCLVLPAAYVQGFVVNGVGLNYKFFITRTEESVRPQRPRMKNKVHGGRNYSRPRYDKA